MPLTASAAPTWRVLDTPRFSVVSQISESETRAWADEFNQFIEALKGVLSTNDRFLTKLTVVLFSRDKDFGKYRPIGENGKVQDWVGAYFSRQDTWSVIGLADHLDDESMRRLIFHEGVHWYLSGAQRRYPMWFDEGLAELFSTFESQKDKVSWGRSIDDHVISLHRKSPLPLKQLLLISQSDPMFNEGDRTSLFYAESWAFVHYLVFGQRKKAQGSLNEFLTAYYGDMTTEEAFRKTFGMDFSAMDSALYSYLNGGRYRICSFPVSPTAKVVAPFVPAPPALVQAALARLAYGTGRKDLAKIHAEDAVRLDPGYADGYKILAWTRCEDESADGFFEAANKAVELGATDADALWLLATAKYKKAVALGGVPANEARQIANLLEKTINLLPTLKSAYLNLANVIPMIEPLNDQDEHFLEFGEKLFPDEQLILVGQAQLLRKKGNKEEALKILTAVLEKPSLLSTQQQAYLKSTKYFWDYADTMERVTALVSQEKYREALTLLDALIARGLTLETRGTVVQFRQEAWARATIQEAGEAKKIGETDEAKRLYQSIINADRVSSRVRDHAARLLEGLKSGERSSSEE